MLHLDYHPEAEIYICLFWQLTPPSIENLNLSTSVHRLPLSFDILKSQSEVLPIKAPKMQQINSTLIGELLA